MINLPVTLGELQELSNVVIDIIEADNTWIMEDGRRGLDIKYLEKDKKSKYRLLKRIRKLLEQAEKIQ